MSLAAYSPHPVDPKPNRVGWPWHGFVYRDGGVEKLRTPAGTVLNADANLRVPGSINASQWSVLEAENGHLGNTAWRLKRPGWTPPSIPSGEVTSEDAAGRTWLGHGIVYRGRNLYGAIRSINQAWAGWWFVGSTGPVCDVYARQVPYYIIPEGPSTKWKIDALVIRPVPSYGSLTAPEVVVPLSESITSAVADVESGIYQLWRLADFSDDGRVALLYLGGVSEAIAVVTISGEYPSLAASIEAVSPKQYPDQRNFTHALFTKTQTYNDPVVTYEDANIVTTYQDNTYTSEFVRAIGHDGTLLKLKEERHTYGYGTAWKWETIECTPGSFIARVEADTHHVTTITWAGATYVSDIVNGGGDENSFVTNGVRYGPVLKMFLRSATYAPGHTCGFSLMSQSSESHAWYKATALSESLQDLQPYQFAIDPDTKQVMTWPSGVSFV